MHCKGITSPEQAAVEMGGAIAGWFTGLLKLRNRDRKIILMMRISAGFALVFRTPPAGAVLPWKLWFWEGRAMRICCPVC